ncbi:hypothetical protein CLV01_1382 [Delftia sp. 60]|uniref:hypothetical protein n=1 Tax=Delftia sp. 60 TaxID=2035216 RepID=UPI000C185A0E|nr:hypothetical protein [Delftia sp. 60]PIF39770.1 hypothetical protein CLU98_5064 [Burkholderiales bacterium 23]PIF65049.1 hypothetical protein CLV01_1382 [Delftia sp. 60]
MNYEFNLWGWYAGMSTTPGARTTTLPPDNMQTHETAGRPRSNFTGLAWVELPYEAPPEPVPEFALPEIVITGIAADREGFVHTPDFTDATVPVGATLAFAAELRAGDQVLTLDDSFRLPIRSRDGRERVVLASMAKGFIRFSVHFEDSRVWEVTQAMVNSDLPPERHMRFKGIKVFAVEA